MCIMSKKIWVFSTAGDLYSFNRLTKEWIEVVVEENQDDRI